MIIRIIGYEQGVNAVIHSTQVEVSVGGKGKYKITPDFFLELLRFSNEREFIIPMEKFSYLMKLYEREEAFKSKYRYHSMYNNLKKIYDESELPGKKTEFRDAHPKKIRKISIRLINWSRSGKVVVYAVKVKFAFAIANSIPTVEGDIPPGFLFYLLYHRDIGLNDIELKKVYHSADLSHHPAYKWNSEMIHAMGKGLGVNKDVVRDNTGGFLGWRHIFKK